MYLDIPGMDSRQLVVCAGVFCCLVAFLQRSLDALCRGATEDFCSVFRYSWEGFEIKWSARVFFAA